MAATTGHVDDRVLREFAQKLAGNEKKIRDRAVKKLRKWLEIRCSSAKESFTEVDLVKIWKGLHYCMWMCDKPLVQEELADNIASLILCLKKDLGVAFLFIDTFFQTQCREWFNIDRLRLDKFMMLFRIFLRQCFVMLKQLGWNKQHIEKLMGILSKQMISDSDKAAPDGPRYHMADIYLQELTRVGAQELKPKQVLMFLRPYCAMLAKSTVKPLANHIVKRVFMPLIDREMDRLLIEEEKQEEESDQEEVEPEQDGQLQDERGPPPMLKVNFQALAQDLFELASSDKTCLGRNRKTIYELVKLMRDLTQGKLPEAEVVSQKDLAQGVRRKDVEKAAQQLLQFEEKMLKGHEHKHKHKKRKAKDMEGEEHSEDEAPNKKSKKHTAHESEDASTDDTEENISVSHKKKSKKRKLNGGHGNMEDAHERIVSETPDSKKKKKKLKELKKENVIESRDATDSSCVDDTGDASKSHEHSSKKKKKKKDINERDPSLHIKENIIEMNGSSTASSDSKNQTEDGTQRKKGKHKLKGTEGKATENNKDDTEDENLMTITEADVTEKTKDEEFLFSGGFEDDDGCDNAQINALVKELTSGKKPKDLSSLTVQDGKKKKKHSKKNKFKNSAGGDMSKHSVEVSVDGDTITKDDTHSSDKTKKKKKKKKRKEDNTDSEHGEGEIEILIPNKKYKGKWKDWFDKEVEKSLGSDSEKVSLNLKEESGEQTGISSGKAFAKFEKSPKMPSAFVNRAMAKVTPNTDGNKKKKKSLQLLTGAHSDPGKKRVSFQLQHNHVQEYADSLNSPASPFDPSARPETGILKPGAPPIQRQLFANKLKKKRKSLS